MNHLSTSRLKLIHADKRDPRFVAIFVVLEDPGRVHGIVEITAKIHLNQNKSLQIFRMIRHRIIEWNILWINFLTTGVIVIKIR